ncbi:MAG TPA: geranylgeranyl reductase family protein [Acidimicrobiia bacterium]|nr:geranylgeranyl reductase family protein [Acidimicrobiia bacterium]
MVLDGGRLSDQAVPSVAVGLTCDLLVVGGGPAGAAAAIRGAAAGLSVVVCDKASFPRDKTCGDGLTTSALRLLERLGLDPPAVAGWEPVHGVAVRSPSGRVVDLPLPADGLFAAVAPRAALDAALLDLAARRGAEIRQGAALRSLRPIPGGMEAIVGNGPVPAPPDDGGPAAGVARAGAAAPGGGSVTARYVVAADGMYSTVRRLTGVPGPHLGEWHAFRQYFTGVADRRLWVIFEPDLLPGYAWVFPVAGGRANVGFGLPRRPGVSVRPMAAQWRDLLQRPALQALLGGAEPEGHHRAWPIPADLARGPLCSGRVLFAGDAAGATDPMTGEGIGQALLTGVLAAEALATDGSDPDAVGRRYRAAVAHHLAPDVRFAAALGAILRSRAGARAAVRAAGLTPWTRRHFARWLFEDYPRALVLTPSRWRRGAFTGPGAYRAA